MRKCCFALLSLAGLFAEEAPSCPTTLARWTTSADLLYWTASEGGLAYGINNKGSLLSVTNGHTERPSFDWNFGFKAGAGYTMHHDEWDIFARYTWIRSTASGSAKAPSDGIIFGSWMAPTDPIFFVGSARAHLILLLQTIDLELGRKFHPCQTIMMRPFIGLKTVFLDQKYRITYGGALIGAQLNDSDVFSGDVDRVKMKNDFWGIGIRIGFNSNWEIYRGFGIYGDVAGSILSGNICVRQNEEIDGVTQLKVRNNESTTTAALELALGLKYAACLNKGKQTLTFRLGWEMQQYYNQNRFMNFVGSTTPGKFTRSMSDVSWTGLTAGLRLDF